MVYVHDSKPETGYINPFAYAFTLALGSVVFLAFGMQLILGSLYQGVIYPGVKVSGVNLSGLTVEEARQKLQSTASGYAVNLKIKDKSYRVSSEELGAKYDYETTAKAAYMVGRNHAFAPLALLEAHNTGNIGYAYTIDTVMQKSFVQKVVAETGVAPTNASVVVADGTFQVQPDKAGLAVDAHQLKQLLEKAVANVSQVTVAIEPIVQEASIKAADTANPIDEAKKFFVMSISLTYESKTFKPSVADIGKWIVFDTVTDKDNQKLSPRIDESRVKDYVLRIASGINKAAVNRKVRIENGIFSEERLGQDGLVVDDTTITNVIMKAVTDKQVVLTASIPTKPVAFKTEYNRVVSLDYGRYIEINLARQRMWVYQDKQVVFESPITSGATGAGFPTVQGLFSIYNKQTNRNLNGYAIGYDYNVFVKYWMPFSGNFGMHDASWRSSFGGSDYYYGGSHGCINMPENAAAFLFDWAPVGTPVWVHS